MAKNRLNISVWDEEYEKTIKLSPENELPNIKLKIIQLKILEVFCFHP